METKQINVYSLNELTEKAKEQARKQFVEQCVEWYAQADWEDFDDTLERVEQLCDCDFMLDSSSHGYSCRTKDHKLDIWHYDDRNDDKRFARFQKKVAAMPTMLWSDDILKEIVAKHKYRDDRYRQANYWNFGDNMSSVIAEFANEIERHTCDYYDDDIVDAYITEEEYLFTENGTYFNL